MSDNTNAEQWVNEKLGKWFWDSGITAYDLCVSLRAENQALREQLEEDKKKAQTIRNISGQLWGQQVLETLAEKILHEIMRNSEAIIRNQPVKPRSALREK